MELVSRTVKCVVFDLDGTLLDTLEDLRAAVNHALASLGEPIISAEQTRAYVGNGVGKLVARALRGGEDNPRYWECLEKMRAFYKAHMAVKTRPYPGIVGLLKELRLKGLKLAVVSNKPDKAVAKLCRRFFPGLIDAALGDRPDRKRKPAPDSVFLALKLLGESRETALYVGDSQVDMETSGKAGIGAIGVTWGFRERKVLEAYKPLALCASARELKEEILKRRAHLKVGVYGGSFDPVHKTHLKLARAAKKQLGLDLCLLVPAFRAPQKEGGSFASPKERLDMLALALKSQKDRCLREETCEILRGGTSYTYETLESLKRRLRPCELYLIVGSDSYKDFPGWRCPERIRLAARLAVYQRAGAEQEIMAPDLQLKGPRDALSSSDIRKALSGRKPLEGLLPAGVRNYIQKNGLYGLPKKDSKK